MLDEDELAEYESQVFGRANPFEEAPISLTEQVWDEEGICQGCFRIAPAPTE